MARFIPAVLTISLAVPSICSAQIPLGSDTPVPLILDQTITTRTARVGDVVHLHTAVDATIDGRRVPRGTAVVGAVIRARRAGRLHGAAELAIGDFTILGAHATPVAQSATVITALPPPHGPRDFYARQTAAEGAILTGMAAGYGGAWLASQWSHSEETVARTGILAGAATIALVKILPRGADLQLSPGGPIVVAFTARMP